MEQLRVEPYDPSSFRTGDILLCHATPKSDPIGGEIQKVTRSLFSHCAMVVRGNDGSLSSWQSYAGYGGVALSDLLSFLKDYQQGSGTTAPAICVRHLTAQLTPGMNAALQQYIAKVNKRPFCSVFEFLENILSGRFGYDTGDANFFCSQLVAATYQAMGLLDTKHPPNWYGPVDFSVENIHLKLQKGATLSDEIWIAL